MTYFRKAEIRPIRGADSKTRYAEPRELKATVTPKQPILAGGMRSTQKPLMELSAVNLSSNLGAHTMKEPREGSLLMYENQVMVKIKSPDREEWKSLLTIKVETKVQGSHGEQILAIELTDEKDPFFLFKMECGETEYFNLKNEQNLVVDFQLFPTKFIELLENCLVVKKEGGLMSEESGMERFQCVLYVGFAPEPIFNIVEINNFKQLTHLSLKLKQGGDEALKQFLAQKFQEYKAESEALSVKLENTEDSLSMQIGANEKLKNELSLEREENRKLTEVLKIEAQKQLNEFKEKKIAEIEELNNNHELEKSNLNEHYEKVLGSKDEKIAQLQSANEELTKRVRDLEAIERELSKGITERDNKLEAQKHKITLLEDELNNIRGNNRDLEMLKFSLEKEIVEFRVRCETLQRQMEDKEQLVAKATGLTESSKAQYSQLEETISIYKANAIKMEDKLKISAQEINKGNEIIKQLQSDIKAGKQKIKELNQTLQEEHQKAKIKDQLIERQEKDIDSWKRNCDSAAMKTDDMAREVGNREEEMKFMKGKMDDMKMKLEEAQKQLESNQQMIQWLNKSLSESQRAGVINRGITSTIKPPLPTAFQPSYSTIEQVSGFKPLGTANYSSRYASKYGISNTLSTGKRSAKDDFVEGPPSQQFLTKTVTASPLSIQGRNLPSYERPSPIYPRASPNDEEKPPVPNEFSEIPAEILPIKYMQP